MSNFQWETTLLSNQGAAIKAAYESQADTNPFSDAEKNDLQNLVTNAGSTWTLLDSFQYTTNEAGQNDLTLEDTGTDWEPYNWLRVVLTPKRAGSGVGIAGAFTVNDLATDEYYYRYFYEYLSWADTSAIADSSLFIQSLGSGSEWTGEYIIQAKPGVLSNVSDDTKRIFWYNSYDMTSDAYAHLRYKMGGYISMPNAADRITKVSAEWAFTSQYLNDTSRIEIYGTNQLEDFVR